MRITPLLLVGGIAVAVGAACYVGPIEKAAPATSQAPTDPESEEEDGSADPEADAPDTDPIGLPCEVEALLATRCQSCHGATPKKAPMALVTYEDLTAMSPFDETQTVAEVSLARMKSSDDPMPPGAAPKATSTELKAFTKWIADDMPRGTCGKTTKKDAGSTTKKDAGTVPKDGGTTKPDAGQPDAGPTSVCTSGVMWASSEKSSKMNPGRACITCHKNVAGDPILQIGGTIYPTLHEPDKCQGAAGASVVVTDATGRKITLTTGSTGNFTLSTAATALVFPVDVKVTKHGIERAMTKPAPHGDCNACHTEAGTNGAPGRILLP